MNDYLLYLSGVITENQLLDKMNSKIPANIKKKVNDELHDIGNYHESIPIRTIEDILEMFNISLINEDGSAFSAIFTGREGRTTIDLAINNVPVTNSMLSLTWHKMPSGRYEIISYLS